MKNSLPSENPFLAFFFFFLHGLALGLFVWFFHRQPWADFSPSETLLFFSLAASLFGLQILLLAYQASHAWKAQAVSVTPENDGPENDGPGNDSRGNNGRGGGVKRLLFLLSALFVFLGIGNAVFYGQPAFEQIRHAFGRTKEEAIVKASYGSEERGYLYGHIDWGLAAKTKRFLAAAPEIKTLHIALEADPRATGSDPFLERKVPQELSALLTLLREEGVTTATDVCAGICAFTFLSGQSRSGDMKTVLEFHPLPDELMLYEEQEDFLRTAGLTEDAVRRIMAATPAFPWSPSLKEMQEGRILTLLPFEREKLFHALFPMSSSARKALEERFSDLREKGGSDSAAWREIIKEGFLLTIMRLLPHAPPEQSAVFATQIADMNRSLLVNGASVCRETDFSAVLQLPYDDEVDPFIFQQHRNLLADILDMVKETPSSPSVNRTGLLLRSGVLPPDPQEAQRMEDIVRAILDRAPDQNGNTCALRAFLYDEISRLPPGDAAAMIVSIRSLERAGKRADTP